MIWRIMFGRSGGYWLFWCSAIYLIVALTCAVYYKSIPAELIQLCWISVLALPFAVPPVGRYFNLDVTWDQKMFNIFKKKEPSNVIQFPSAPQYPQYGDGDEPPPTKSKPQEHYRVGFDTDGRTTLTLLSGGSSMTLSMNQDACEHLIKILRSTYTNEVEDE